MRGGGAAITPNQQKLFKRGIMGDKNVEFEEEQDALLRAHLTRIVVACDRMPEHWVRVMALFVRLGLIDDTNSSGFDVDAAMSCLASLAPVGRLRVHRWMHLDLQLEGCVVHACRRRKLGVVFDLARAKSSHDDENKSGTTPSLAPRTPRQLWHLHALADLWTPSMKTRIADGLRRAANTRRGERLYLRHGGSRRVWAMSDLHVDVKANMAFVHDLRPALEDTILVAGDLSQVFDQIEEALTAVVSKFKYVFFVPGNHDLWLTQDEFDDRKTSVHKFLRLIELCDRLGVHTEPAYINDGLLVVPLLSWYDPKFFSGSPGVMRSFDSSCVWPPWLQTANETQEFEDRKGTSLDPAISEWFLKLNEPSISFVRSELDDATRPQIPVVITMSHFLPKPELFVGFKALGHVMGCRALDEQVRSIDARVHVFGHSHINIDANIEGVR